MEANLDQKVVVITGSTRGIGFALAGAFVGKGCRVVVSGRRQRDVDEAVRMLNEKHGHQIAVGKACDVQDEKNLQALWDFAIKELGRVDIWINNAGISNKLAMIKDIPPDEVRNVIATNMLGEIFGSQVALRGFKKQGYGALYNMEGMGAKKGRMIDGLSIYGTTKAGLRYFNDAIAHENLKEGILIGALLPGMVQTDMVTGQYIGKPEDWERVKRVFDAISGEVHQVADWLAAKMLANTKNGVRFTYSNPVKIMARMLKMALFKK